MFRVNDKFSFENNDYVIKEFLGNGGMGYVFSVENQNSNQFALKMIPYINASNDDEYRSIINEWEKAQLINHVNAIKYHGFNDGLTSVKNPFLLMELARDKTLAEFLRNQNTLLSEDECLGIFYQLIDGIEAINAELVHRDLKPENILIDRGVFKISDFGLAKIAEDKTRTKTFKGWGTPPYIAPEAWRSEKNTIQMDMYAMGHIFYQISTLRHAFGNPPNWEEAHLYSTPQPVSNLNSNISPKVSQVIGKLLSKKPIQRYENWQAVRDSLSIAKTNVGVNSSVIDTILRNKQQRDLQREQEESKAIQQQQLVERKTNLIKFSFRNDVLEPIESFVSEFNRISDLEKIKNVSNLSGSELSYQVNYGDRWVKLNLHLIRESDNLPSKQRNLFGEMVNTSIAPKLHNKLILAWGAIENFEGKGMNIVLVESNIDEYGDWFVLENSDSGFGLRNKPRPTPFAFSNNELIKEIHNVGVMHIYKIKAVPLTGDKIIKFIESSL
ncbi:hypothetical protein GCM10010099_24140 [Streptomyces cinereus]|nr:hypothetical protein GCM10010099_24140 [Streptomyces cinereus]